MKLSATKVDAARISQGAWVDDIPEMPDLRLNVRGFDNADDRRISAAEYEKVPRAQRLRGKLDDTQADAIMTERLVGAILCDWDGLTDDAEIPIPYSQDKAREILADPDYKPFREAVIWAARVIMSERAENTEDDRKNSSSPSVGK